MTPAFLLIRELETRAHALDVDRTDLLIQAHKELLISWLESKANDPWALLRLRGAPVGGRR